MENKKIFSIICMLILIITPTFSMVSAQDTIEEPVQLLDKMVLSHIKIDGNGSSIIIYSSFVLGFGRCTYMRLNMDEFSHIEINKFLDETNQVVLDGHYVVTIFGFVGYFRERGNSITLNGFATIVYWR